MFSKDKNQIKTTKTFSSVDNTRFKKVLQRKQRLYEKFKTIRCKSKRNYYSQKILENKNNAKETWNIM